ncbi:hypothetical protein RSOLAG1IB_03837 [Rhizoctonia solani AG-1 IB]|uniref:Uncharacterized protein n=1 Tax=Thanatephorus cucumeris (strain AG1-IB / isolate 7/3/14) TaxID=1108050 RepID=A0A0B7FUT1_THACB|nr:hypothetical protein RSOLAG1IB_03837 [Rhizoctonia solani AG-1 IB]
MLDRTSPQCYFKRRSIEISRWITNTLPTSRYSVQNANTSSVRSAKRILLRSARMLSCLFSVVCCGDSSAAKKSGVKH